MQHCCMAVQHGVMSPSAGCIKRCADPTALATVCRRLQVRLLLVKICDCAASNPSETLAALEKFKHDAIEHGDVNGLTPLQAAADA